MYSIKELDFGTPLRVSSKLVTLEIDGQSVTVPEGTSVMAAAAMAGVRVPKLCATDMLDAFGSCRLCLVEIDGRKGYPASCTTLAEPGMKVRTQTPKLARLRRGVMELYISDHPLDCLTCPARKTPPTLISASIRASASSVRAACARARTCKALSR